jgi:SAM-dependent methyltransferase
MGINPQPSDDTLATIYSEDYFRLSNTEKGLEHIHFLKQQTAEHYVQLIEDYLGHDNKRMANKMLLEVGVGLGDFLKVAASKGSDVSGIEYSQSSVNKARNFLGNGIPITQGEIHGLSDTKRFDIIVFNDVLEHVRDPRLFLEKVYGSLTDHGVVFCAIPSLDSWSARWQGSNWVEFKLEHLFYFNEANARRLLYSTGFKNVVTLPSTKTLSLLYIAEHFEAHPRGGWSQAFRLMKAAMPDFVLRYPFPIVASGIVLMATKGDLERTILVTVIMAVFNEAPTVRAAIEGVLSKNVRDCEIELLIIESNSTDGSREIVNEYLGHERVGIILEEEPRGKGHAVRQGLIAAKGDIILIQDADLEYDFEDYDALIETLRDGKHAFVLGSRHGGEKWKVRHFEGQPIVAFLANTVHWILTLLINILFRVRLTDPFTMFKVFRRSAIHGLTFSSNRFDFDYELLLKLIRRGYTPIEIPVNYSARSFQQGKKVRFFRDPLTWVWAIIKFRFSSLGTNN